MDTRVRESLSISQVATKISRLAENGGHIFLDTPSVFLLSAITGISAGGEERKEDLSLRVSFFRGGFPKLQKMAYEWQPVPFALSSGAEAGEGLEGNSRSSYLVALPLSLVPRSSPPENNPSLCTLQMFCNES